jgi:hypothetical protein
MSLMSSVCTVARADELAEPKKRVSETRSAVTKAKVAVTLAARKIQKDFEATAEWKKADAASKDAQSRYSTAVRVARAALGKNPAFKQAVAERGQREAELNALKAAEPRDEQAIASASVALLKAVETTSRLDHQALSADPKVVEAKAAADAATAELAELRKAEVERVQGSPEFQAAREQLQQASAAYEQAAGELNQARKQQAAAESQNLDQEIDAKRRQMLDAAQRR